ncbi:hypothetical protein FRC09_004125 [Ceratobasidium sp. 395]|nr:hypothetical protein FRC09_004125 [Ceratobasidium sp. 395]
MSNPTVDPTRDLGLKSKPRKLIVCIDGTANQFSENNTNVVEIYSRITKDSTQLTYYNSGVGTYARPFWWSFAYFKQQFTNFVDLMIAWNFDQIIFGAYRWLADNYEPGDQIWLFGFSRGAYQVRTLAGMIETVRLAITINPLISLNQEHQVGLIRPGNQEQIPFAWALYSDGDEDSLAKSKFKAAFGQEKVDLHFVGVWDTVASVGLLPRNPFPLSNECKHITHFRHALALDECRVKFLPEHLNQAPIKRNQSRNQSRWEVWFAGTHSDIGGGNKANPTLDRGGEPLKWMMEEAYAQGLSVRLYDVKIGVPRAAVTDSMRADSMRGLLYNFLEVLPFLCWKEYFSNGQSKSIWWPHLASPREVLPRHSIHWTVNANLARNSSKQLDTTKKAYIPKAILLDGRVSEEEWGWGREMEREAEWERGEEREQEEKEQEEREKEEREQEEGGEEEGEEGGEEEEGEEEEEEWETEDIKKTIKWDDLDVFEGRGLYEDERPPGLPCWTDDPAFMFNLLKTEPKPANDEWFKSLNNYALGQDSGKPDAIWAYGGPQLLQKLFETYRDRKNTVQIARSIIGFDSELESSSLAGALKPTATDDEKEMEQDLARRLHDMVIPRAILLLEGWVAEDVDPKSKDMDEADPIDVEWNWIWIPKKNRSMELARVATDILSDIAKTRFSHVMLNTSEKLANLIMMVIHDMIGKRKTRIKSATSWEKNQAALAEGALNVVMALLNLGNDAPRDVFHFEDTTVAIRFLIRAKEKHPKLSLQAMRTAAVLIQDSWSGLDITTSAIVSDLVGMMQDYTAEDDPVKQQLADEASITVVTLTKNSRWCCSTVAYESELLEKTLQILKAEKHVDNILQVFKSVSTDYSTQFSPEHVEHIFGHIDENVDALLTLANIASQHKFDTAFWDVFNNNKIADNAVNLLNRQETQVQAAARLLRGLIDQEPSLTKVTDEPLNTHMVLPDVFLALTASLREPSLSQVAIDELLATIMRLLLLKPSLGNKITVSTLGAEIPGLTTMALAGNPRAILAVSAAFAHYRDNKERASQYMLSLAQMITPEDQKFLKDSIEVITSLVNEGYSLQKFHAESVMDALVVILRAIYAVRLFTADAPESGWDKDKVTYAAFGLFEALCADPNNRSYLTNTGIFETIILPVGWSTASPSYDVKERAKAMMDRLAGYEDLAAKIEMLRAQDPETDDEGTDETQINAGKSAEVVGDQGEVGKLEERPKSTSEAASEADETGYIKKLILSWRVTTGELLFSMIRPVNMM